MVRSIPLVAPALAEYIALCRVLKSHALLVPQLDDCVVGVLDILEMEVLLVDVIPVVLSKRSSGRTLFSFDSAMAVMELWY